jgi:hypothetical protein
MNNMLISSMRLCTSHGSWRMLLIGIRLHVCWSLDR